MRKKTSSILASCSLLLSIFNGAHEEISSPLLSKNKMQSEVLVSLALSPLIH